MITKDIIKKFNVRPVKSLGQNFLQDETVVKRIVDAANISEKDLILEIGPGIGIMTKEIASRAGYVVAVEIDKHLLPVLQENLKDFKNFKLINGDILEFDFRKGMMEALQLSDMPTGVEKIKVVANLPYYITTPIIMKLFEEARGIDTMIFMVQKEVASRMTAFPGRKEYGALSVAVQYYSKPEKLFNVPPHCFIPQPEVDSSVVKLCIYEKPPVELYDRDTFFMLVKAAFGQRRKTLVNALYNSQNFIKSKEEIKKILNQAGIDENQRGETLTIMQFAELANAFFTKKA